MALTPENQEKLWKAAVELRHFTLEEAVTASGMFPRAVRERLDQLVKEGKLHHICDDKKKYYAPPPAPPKQPRTQLPRVPATADGAWTIIRKLKRFTVVELQRATKMKPADIRSVLLPLVKGGYLEALGRGRNKRVYNLKRDNGVHRPILLRDGRQRQPRPRERMWMAIKALKNVEPRDLAMAAQVSVGSAKTYCALLAQAGFLVADVHKLGRCKFPIYRFIRARDPGPKPPVVTAQRRAA